MSRIPKFLLGLLAVSPALAAFQVPSGPGEIAWWVWLLILALLVVAFVLLIWWVRRRRAAKAAPTPKLAAPVAPPRPAEVKPIPAPAPMPKPEPLKPSKPDDLTILEGIGPKITGVLQAAGITTFAQLAATDVSRLYQILDAAKMQFIEPGSWPEQAKLAADGKWDALKTLQDQLKGGRRV
jgi:predicted flap endonuclease-1-like 5' DNA nuclease